MLCRDSIRFCVEMPSHVVWRCHQMLCKDAIICCVEMQMCGDAIRCCVEMPSDAV